MKSKENSFVSHPNENASLGSPHIEQSNNNPNYQADAGTVPDATKVTITFPEGAYSHSEVSGQWQIPDTPSCNVSHSLKKGNKHNKYKRNS
jgi:hypothetical protein